MYVLSVAEIFNQDVFTVLRRKLNESHKVQEVDRPDWVFRLPTPMISLQTLSHKDT